MLKTPYMKNLILGQGADIIGNSPVEFARYTKADIDKWSKLTRDAGIKAE
jgi:hypothetical protein